MPERIVDRWAGLYATNLEHIIFTARIFGRFRKTYWGRIEDVLVLFSRVWYINPVGSQGYMLDCFFIASNLENDPQRRSDTPAAGMFHGG